VNDKPTVKWIRDPRAIGKATATMTIEGAYAGASAAGHVFMWRVASGQVAGQLELAVYLDGKPIGTMPTDGPVSLWPDPTGARVAQVGANAVGLYQVDGKLLWQVPLAGTQEAVWLADGGLAITSAGGIARLDPASGAILAARCGWQFGLSSKQHPTTSRIEPLCSQVAP
jgi:hypothetical protein